MVRPAVQAVVRTWHDEDGWGVLDCPDTPGGCWAGFAAVAVEGYRRLRPEQPVWLEWEPAEQDGFAFRAVRTWPGDAEPHDAPPDDAPPEDAERGGQRDGRGVRQLPEHRP